MTALFVAATIIVFLGIDWAVRRMKSRASQAEVQAPAMQNEAYPLRIPEGVYFSKSHTWITLFPSGEARIGIDDFIGSVVGDPEVTFMRGIGEHVRKGDPLAVLSAGDRRLVIRAPLAGEVIRVNSDLEKNPGSMRDQLFSQGWAYTIRPVKTDDVRSLMLGEESRNWMRSELSRLKDLFAGSFANGALAPAFLQDGGAPAVGALKHMDAGAWQKFEEEFLQVQ
jgi:glycine cleavage system H protein